MARIRTIKPEFWTNERVMECSMAARLLFIGMWNFADDNGRLSLSAKTIKAQIFPSDDITSDNVLGMVAELSKNGLVLVYAVDGRDFLQIVGWQHQRIDKPQPGRCPGPVNGYSDAIPGYSEPEISRSTNIPGMVAEHSPTEWKGRDSKGKDSDAIASAADAADPRTRLFNEGLSKLAAMTGKGPDSCRSFLGKCLKASDDDATVVLGLIEDAERNRVANAPAWISARLKGNNNGNAKTGIIAASDKLLEIIGSFDGGPSGNNQLCGTASATNVRVLPAR